MPSLKPVLIAGPTASGKSGLALELAERLNGTIVNADALQVYSEWRILTARPDDEEQSRAPHTLYGHVSVRDASYSTGRWLRELGLELEAIRSANRRPIITGGTGLYFKALTEGLAEIPPTPSDVRTAVEERLEANGPEALAAELKARDPGSAAKVDLANPRRVLRALEVLDATGVGFAEWMTRTPPPLLPLNSVLPLRLTPPRDWLRDRIEQRFRMMVDNGAMDEVRAVVDIEREGDTPPSAPGLKALGYPPLRAHLMGECTLYDAIESSVTETHQYAKRQTTWLRNQMGDWRTIEDVSTDLVATLCRELESDLDD